MAWVRGPEGACLRGGPVGAVANEPAAVLLAPELGVVGAVEDAGAAVGEEVDVIDGGVEGGAVGEGEVGEGGVDVGGAAVVGVEVEEDVRVGDGEGDEVGVDGVADLRCGVVRRGVGAGGAGIVSAAAGAGGEEQQAGNEDEHPASHGKASAVRIRGGRRPGLVVGCSGPDSGAYAGGGLGAGLVYCAPLGAPRPRAQGLAGCECCST